MKVYVLEIGWLESERSALVSGARPGKTKLPVLAVLIDHPQGKILFDTGCHPQAMEGYWPEHLKKIFPYYSEEGMSLPAQLALCQTTPNEIKTVVLSHMHLDHAGNLALFPQADVYIHKADFIYALTCVHQSTQIEDHGAYIKADIEVPIKKYHLVEEDLTLLDGVDIVTLPGHTPGVLGMVIHLEKDGVLIFPQDAVDTKDNYGPPAKASGIMYDKTAYFESIEKVRALADKYQAQVIFAHDKDDFQTLKHAPCFYQ